MSDSGKLAVVVGVSLGQGTASASTSSASQIGRASFAGACAALVRLLQIRKSEFSAVETAFAFAAGDSPEDDELESTLRASEGRAGDGSCSLASEIDRYY